jgi:release factor glutamine methyltransferase
VAGVPLEHLVGWAEFADIRVVVRPGVFVPRARTGLLVDLAVGIVRDGMAAFPPERQPLRRGLSRWGPVVVDLCCGSGAVGAALSARLPHAEVHAADVDETCVACARENLPPERVHQGDLYAALPDGLRGRIDVLVVNAPYVPTHAIATMPGEARDHEPQLALDGGSDGIDVHRRVAAQAPEWLRAGGSLVVETSRSQAPLTAAACEQAGLTTRVETDHARDATAVVATAP